MKTLEKCERYFTPFGRIVLGAFFVLAGIDKMMNISGTASYIESIGLPAGTLLAFGAIVIEFGVGGALLVGYQARYAALVLAGFVLVVSVLFHGPSMWSENPMQQVLFMKNIAIFGGLIFMAAHIGAPCCMPHSHTKAADTSPNPTL